MTEKIFKKLPQVDDNLKSNLPGFGHVFDFDNFTKGAFAQGGLHSICKAHKRNRIQTRAIFKTCLI